MSTRENSPDLRLGWFAAHRARRVEQLTTVAFYGVTAFLAVTLVFFLPRLMPGDPLLAHLDPTNPGFIYDAHAREAYRAYYGLDKPLLVQYWHYLSDLVHGDLGWSIGQNAPVSKLIASHLPWTLLLVGTAIVVSALGSFVAGVSAAWHRGRTGDRALIVTSTVARAIPEYAWAVLLLIAFAVLLPVFPLSGAKTPFADYGALAAVGDVLKHLALPATALALSLIGGKFLLVRNTTISALGQDYMLLARAKGLSRRRMKYHHAARNSLLPFMTVLGIQTGFAVGGAVLVESVFAYPGMGSLILQAVDQRDYPVLEACFLVLAGTVLALNLIVDLLYAWVDPAVRAE